MLFSFNFPEVIFGPEIQRTKTHVGPEVRQLWPGKYKSAPLLNEWMKLGRFQVRSKTDLEPA